MDGEPPQLIYACSYYSTALFVYLLKGIESCEGYLLFQCVVLTGSLVPGVELKFGKSKTCELSKLTAAITARRLRKFGAIGVKASAVLQRRLLTVRSY